MIEMMQDPHFWVELAFVLFILLVFIFGRTKVIAAIDGRRHKIAASIEKSQNLLKEAEMHQKQAEEMLATAKIQAQSILEQAKKDAKSLVSDATKRAEENALKKMQALEVRINQEEQRIMNDAKNSIADLSVHYAREMLQNVLQDKQGQKIFADSLKNISKEKIGA